DLAGAAQEAYGAQAAQGGVGQDDLVLGDADGVRAVGAGQLVEGGGVAGGADTEHDQGVLVAASVAVAVDAEVLVDVLEVDDGADDALVDDDVAAGGAGGAVDDGAGRV